MASTVYGLYSPANLRIGVQSGVQTGSLQLYRFITTDQTEVAYGKTSFNGQAGALSMGYEMGNEWGGKNLSLIPSVAVGYRGQTAKSYSERASDERLALTVPQMMHHQFYTAVQLEARAQLSFNQFAVLPMAGLSVERANTGVTQTGLLGLVTDPTVNFDAEGAPQQKSIAMNYHLGMDLIAADQNRLALHSEFQRAKLGSHAVNSLNFGLKGKF